MSLGALVGGVAGGFVGFFVGGPMGAVYGASIGFAGGMMLDPVMPDLPTTGLPSPEEQVMTSTIGDPVKDLCGTAKITGHLLAYGAERNEAIYSDSAGGGGKGSEPEPQIVGYNYYMSWAVGICVGPIDTIYTIYKNNDIVWENDSGLDIPASGGVETITLEGMGSCTFYFGTDDQEANANYGSILPDDTLNSPMRHFCWCFFDDCHIGEYNRTPTMKFVVRRQPSVTLPDESAVSQAFDSNPMHAIWYILNNLCQLDETWLNESEFEEVADVLLLEGRGISMLIDRDQTALDYIQVINQHIDGILRYGSDAQFHPKLIRDDYDIATIPTLDEVDCLDDPSFTRKSWIDTLNETKVQYTEIKTIRPPVIVSENGGYAPGYGIAYSPTLGGSLGRFVVVSMKTSIVRYSDDGGVTWVDTSNNAPAESIEWIPELGGFICTYSHSIGFSADGINWTQSNSCHEYDYVNGSEICYSERTGLVWVVSQRGGGSTKCHTTSNGTVLNVETDIIGYYHQCDGGCSAGLKDYFFSPNYNHTFQCIEPDTHMNSWGPASQSPGSLDKYPRKRLLSNGNNILIYSGCYNRQELGWAANVGPEDIPVAWSIGTFGYGKFAVFNPNTSLDGTTFPMYYSTDGAEYKDMEAGLSIRSIWEDCAIGKDRVVTIQRSDTGLCRISKFS